MNTNLVAALVSSFVFSSVGAMASTGHTVADKKDDRKQDDRKQDDRKKGGEKSCSGDTGGGEKSCSGGKDGEKSGSGGK